jgi:hypothetical protein
MINFKAAMCIDSGERDSCSPCGFLTLSDEYSLDHYYRNDNCFIGKGTTVINVISSNLCTSELPSVH